MTKHLFDLTQGSRRKPACDAVSDDIVSEERFDKLKPSEQCPTCVEEHAAALLWNRTCRICLLTFANSELGAQHERLHVLSAASYRKEPDAFLLTTQRYYDESHSKARMLASAYAELAKYRSGKPFAVIPSRIMLRSDGSNGSIMGEGHIVDYLFVQT